jgi:hypothetical protein
MAAPAIVWRNPNAVQRRRLWNQARRDATRRLYIVVRSAPGNQGEWEGLPNLEVLDGGTIARKTVHRGAQTTA